MVVNEATFQRDVVERSHQVPVVVDFWAAWCGPCRQLGPLLEREVEKRAGQVVLAKVDVDANPRLAQTFRIQGIPAVKAFRMGAVVSEFTGAQPALAVERFLDELVPSAADALVAAGDEASLREAVRLEPTRADAAVPLARLLHARGETDEAVGVLKRVPGSFAADGLVAHIELQGRAEDEAPPASEIVEGLRALDAGDPERGLELLLGALSDADGARDDVRRVIVGVLEELGVASELARSARRRLAVALY